MKRSSNLKSFSYIFYFSEWVMADSGWGPWSGWQCTATCGGGAGRKTRQCINPGPNRCPGSRQKYGKCNEQPCPVVPKPLSNKGWTPWMPWDCPVTCGGGRGTRSRICEDPDICEGPEEETGPCAEQPCPVDEEDVNENLQRQIKQQLETARHNFVVKLGETIIIPCKDRMASVLDQENPNAKVNWVHNGHLVELDGKRKKMEANGDLKVKTSLTDNGLWWCSVGLTSKVSMTVSFASVGVQNEKPDIVVEMGSSFEMKCMAVRLSRLVKSKLDQRWMHNSSTFKETKDVQPDRKDTFRISSSNYSHSGIWNCRYSESFGSREWVTSVYRILVVPPRTLVEKILPVLLAVVASLVIIGAACKVYWSRVKKKQLAEFVGEDDEFEFDEDWEDEDEPTPLFANKLRKYQGRRTS